MGHIVLYFLHFLKGDNGFDFLFASTLNEKLAPGYLD